MVKLPRSGSSSVSLGPLFGPKWPPVNFASLLARFPVVISETFHLSLGAIWSDRLESDEMPPELECSGGEDEATVGGGVGEEAAEEEAMAEAPELEARGMVSWSLEPPPGRLVSPPEVR